ncbi:hypothetical protein M407DRAFT_23155 [Tulasnella calospora MUT 4182]|uniref:Uncharacterized protein n=1 Tax=Tulasnella calospora MUT 4182 TaxID=1051891 RepID=A0A0C3M1J8_9AGAM|nr:hypothetical protein M407DRAFT_23155 [Tulasnella calospora MUT 4182]
MPVYRVETPSKNSYNVLPGVADYLIAYHQRQKAEFRNLVEEAEVEYLLFSEPITPSPSPSPEPSQPPSHSSSPTILERIEEATELRYYYFLDLTHIDHDSRRICHPVPNLYNLVRDIRICPEEHYL